MKIIEIGERSARKSTRQFVYETLKNNILTLKLEPGFAISENEIAQLLQVSRTPVREAFIKLAEEDLITIYPQKGTFVSLIDLDHVEEALFVRSNLEIGVARYACETLSREDIEELEEMVETQRLASSRNNYPKLFNLDEEFHRTIFEKCKKSRTWFVVQQMYSHYKRVRLLLLVAKFDWELILKQHAELVEAIKNKQRDRAEKVMKEHLDLLLFEKEGLKQRFPHYFK